MTTFKDKRRQIEILVSGFSNKDINVRRAAENCFPTVIHSSFDLLVFVSMFDTKRGWGRMVRRVVGRWYNEKRGFNVEVEKVRKFSGWSHADVIRLAHVKATDEDRNTILRELVGKNVL
jgi:60 kDa SS-A/Ro ribonucleoprotein